jgi:transposase
MSRAFKTADYPATLEVTVRLGDLLPAEHLARFVVDAVAQLDLAALYARYGARGGQPYAPEILLGLLFYGYATGVFSSRKIERATYDSVPFRFLAGNLHPDHDTVAAFRKSFLPELKGLFVQILLLARLAGVLQLGKISLDGTKLHADAAKSQAVSYKRLLELERRLQAEVEELFALAERSEGAELPEGLVVGEEIARREGRLARLAVAKAVLEERARAREAQDQAVYDAKVREREEKARQSGRKPRGPAPQPPTPGPRDQDQYNFTDPESRIMKNSTNQGFDQDYNAQIAVDQDSYFILRLRSGRGCHCPTIPMIRPKRNRRWRRSHRRWAPRWRPRWTTGTSARRTSSCSKAVASSRTSRPAASRTIGAGKSGLPSSQPHPRRRPARRSRWPTS